MQPQLSKKLSNDSEVLKMPLLTDAELRYLGPKNKPCNIADGDSLLPVILPNSRMF